MLGRRRVIPDEAVQERHRGTDAVVRDAKSPLVVPAGSYFCYTVDVTSVTNGGLTLQVDAAATPTALISSQIIFIPELVLPLVGLSLLAPFASRLRRRNRGSRS